MRPPKQNDNPLALASFVWPSFYQDSVQLMLLARTIRSRAGVSEAAALMGTPMNHDIMLQAGLVGENGMDAGPNDLMLAVEADSRGIALEAIEEAKAALLTRERSVVGGGRDFSPSSLEGALAAAPDSSLAMISLPGAYAPREAMNALRRGLHVFLFSDNVSVDDEVALKREAIRRGLLLMGPDCGTAYIGGAGLGFANVVRPGRVGCVAASGTGLQSLASQLDALGEGISHGVGVGGRDLSAEVGGLMTLGALDFLSADPETQIVALVSKPPAAEVLPKIEEALESLQKPHVVCFLGAENPRWAKSLEDAGRAVAEILQGERRLPEDSFARMGWKERIASLGRERSPGGGGILGLFSGGTLAHESRLIIGSLLGEEIAWNGEAGRHRILDLGDDRYTAGKPHPMIDPQPRAEMVREAATDENTGVVLFDLILGRGSAADPAGALARAIREAGSRARSLLFVASVVGTANDPQDMGGQIGVLEEAGAVVLPSSAQAARFAAALIRPELLDAG